MTLVAVWQHEPDRIHAVADTRFSHERGVATEHGPKLLPLNVVCRKPKPGGGRFNVEHFRTEFGFAYSGSTLAALSAHTLANIVCTNLIGMENFVPPAIDDIALATGDICLQYMREVGQLSAHAGLFKAILFGICPKTHEAIAFEMKPKIEPTGVNLEITRHLLTSETVIVIGDRQQLLHDRIAKVRSGASHPIVFADAPERALQSLIDDGSIKSVGGALQQAWATPGKLELIATLRPIEVRPPAPRNAGLFLLGFDIMDMQTVGGYRVSMTGR
jgi:hypothetical protein